MLPPGSSRSISVHTSTSPATLATKKLSVTKVPKVLSNENIELSATKRLSVTKVECHQGSERAGNHEDIFLKSTKNSPKSSLGVRTFLANWSEAVFNDKSRTAHMLSKSMLNALFLSALALICCSGCGESTTAQTARETQIGGESLVSPSSLSGKTSSHRTGQHDFQFSWKFDATNFEIFGDSIPTDLLKDLGYAGQVGKITGQWKIENRIIHLTTDVNGETKNCEMKIFATGPTRIQSSDAQYVF